MICSGCIHAPVYDDQGNKVDINKQNECPFCRVVAPKSNKVSIERLKKRMEANDANAMRNVGCYYGNGRNGFPQDFKKALELWHRAAELGHAAAYNSIGLAYYLGKGVEVDKKKANHYYELAAMGGDVNARGNLGLYEAKAGNMDRALKHFMIAIRSGSSKSLNQIKQMYNHGDVTKEDYTEALRTYQAYLSDIKSPQRDEASAASEEYRYY